jgi:hypothetical protein
MDTWQKAVTLWSNSVESAEIRIIIMESAIRKRNRNVSTALGPGGGK